MYMGYKQELAHLGQRSPIFLAPGTPTKGGLESGDGWRDRRWSSGGNVSEAWLHSPPLTSCCVARFLTDHGPVLVHSHVVGDP